MEEKANSRARRREKEAGGMVLFSMLECALSRGDCFGGLALEQWSIRKGGGHSSSAGRMKKKLAKDRKTNVDWKE